MPAVMGPRAGHMWGRHPTTRQQFETRDALQCPFPAHGSSRRKCRLGFPHESPLSRASQGFSARSSCFSARDRIQHNRGSNPHGNAHSAPHTMWLGSLDVRGRCRFATGNGRVVSSAYAWMSLDSTSSPAIMNADCGSSSRCFSAASLPRWRTTAAASCLRFLSSKQLT